MLPLPPLGNGTIIAPVFLNGGNLSAHDMKERGHMVGGFSVSAAYMGRGNDVGVGSNDPLYLASPFAGVSQFARMNSSTVKWSLVLCRFTQASGWKYLSS